MSKEVLGDRISDATEVSFSFDTTGSMSPCIANVRQQLEKTLEGMFSNIPGLRVGLIAHGDYCDGVNCISVLKLTDDRTKIFEFVRNAPNTSGGDAPECYELALHEARDLGWTPGVAAALVLIGDAAPHDVDYPENEGKLDWKVELAALKEMGVKVFPLQCLKSESYFWGEVAQLSDTPLMRLDEFCDSAATLEGVAFAAAGSEAYARYEGTITASACSAGVMRNASVLRDVAKDYDEKH
jgi:hypothetical protein